MQPLAEGNDMLLTAINAKIEPIVRQLERMEERMEARTSNLVTRHDLEVLRGELITKDAFTPQLAALKEQIARTDADRLEDRRALLARVNQLENEQLGRQDRLWIRISQVVAALAFALSMIDILMHLKITP